MKRIISVFMAMMLTMFTAACASAAETNEPQLTAENGKITVTNAVDNGALILAFYDNGVLAGANMYQGNGTIEADLATAPENATDVKAFYWNMVNIMPIGNMIALPLSDEPTDDAEKGDTIMKMRVASGDVEVVFELNNTSAAKSLYNQLPLTIDVENYGGNEKIFYPEKLDCSNVIEGDCPTGTLAYFSPWGDVVMYYAPASRYSGLYILGEAVEGVDNISRLSGEIEITKVN